MYTRILCIQVVYMYMYTMCTCTMYMYMYVPLNYILNALDTLLSQIQPQKSGHPHYNQDTSIP